MCLPTVYINTIVTSKFAQAHVMTMTYHCHLVNSDAISSKYILISGKLKCGGKCTFQK